MAFYRAVISGGGCSFDKIYVIATKATGSTNAAIKIIGVTASGYDTLERTYGQISNNPYQDDYIKITYGSQNWKVTLQKNGYVNGTQRSSGYSFSWGFGTIPNNIIEFV